MVPIWADRAVTRQIELHGDALPARVGMRRDQVAGNVAGQHRDRIHAGLGVTGTEPPFERRRQPPDEGIAYRCRAQRAADDVPHRALLRRQVADIFRKHVDLHPRMGAVGEIVALAAAVHRPVVGGIRHVGQHGVVDVVGEDPVEHQVIERRIGSRRRVHRGDNEIAQPLGGQPAVARVQFNRLIHQPILVRWAPRPGRFAPAV